MKEQELYSQESSLKQDSLWGQAAIWLSMTNTADGWTEVSLMQVAITINHH